MTRDDIIRLARDAGLTGLRESDILGNFERFAALVAAQEREACVLELERNADKMLEEIVAIIRSRGEVKP